MISGRKLRHSKIYLVEARANQSREVGGDSHAPYGNFQCRTQSKRGLDEHTVSGDGRCWSKTGAVDRQEFTRAGRPHRGTGAK